MEEMRPKIVQWLMFEEQRRIVEKLKGNARIARITEQPGGFSAKRELPAPEAAPDAQPEALPQPPPETTTAPPPAVTIAPPAKKPPSGAIAAAPKTTPPPITFAPPAGIIPEAAPTSPSPQPGDREL
jgi:hypothetical protein